jgi:ElaB/YqjD/DUF883 family membrane-anchored ribosome-binding protein
MNTSKTLTILALIASFTLGLVSYAEAGKLSRNGKQWSNGMQWGNGMQYNGFQGNAPSPRPMGPRFQVPLVKHKVPHPPAHLTVTPRIHTPAPRPMSPSWKSLVPLPQEAGTQQHLYEAAEELRRMQEEAERRAEERSRQQQEEAERIRRQAEEWEEYAEKLMEKYREQMAEQEKPEAWGSVSELPKAAISVSTGGGSEETDND